MLQHQHSSGNLHAPKSQKRLVNPKIGATGFPNPPSMASGGAINSRTKENAQVSGSTADFNPSYLRQRTANATYAVG